jgi:hypothetical protein
MAAGSRAADYRDDLALAVTALAAVSLPDPPLFSTWAARLD